MSAIEQVLPNQPKSRLYVELADNPGDIEAS